MLEDVNLQVPPLVLYHHAYLDLQVDPVLKDETFEIKSQQEHSKLSKITESKKLMHIQLCNTIS